MTLAITMGDASGVGPEIALKAWHEKDIPSGCVLIGDLSVLEQCARQLRLDVPLRKMAGIENAPEPSHLNVYDVGLIAPGEIEVGRVSGVSGHAALKYVEIGVMAVQRKLFSALVTLPMNKEATRLTIPHFSGHTGYIAELCGTERYTMMLASDQMIVTHVSTHVSVREAVDLVRKPRILDVIDLTVEATRKLRGRARIAVAGLNPHAGEGGAFGREEETEIQPAIQAARDNGIDVQGPFPPDTIFPKVLRGEFDAIVCMYHDQGHIPMKVLDFEGAVNVTLGLPIVRTSVDHGTAFDIAWKGIASTRSFTLACRMAELLAAKSPGPGS